MEILKRLLEQLNSSQSTVEQKLQILAELEYLVHQVMSHSYISAILAFMGDTYYLCMCVRWTMVKPCVPQGVSS